MKKRATLPAFFLLALLAVSHATNLFAAPAAFANETVTIEELVSDMKKYDGKEVTIEGEAIGDVMVRGEYAWITVNDDAYSKRSLEEGGDFAGYSNIGIGVWVPKQYAESINLAGGYKVAGDHLRVTGIFNRACHEHGGDTDIHADSLEVTRSGHEIPHGFQYGKLLAVIILACAIAFLWNLRRSKIKRGKHEV